MRRYRDREDHKNITHMHAHGHTHNHYMKRISPAPNYYGRTDKCDKKSTYFTLQLFFKFHNFGQKPYLYGYLARINMLMNFYIEDPKYITFITEIPRII
jgi:hypothetical protein